MSWTNDPPTETGWYWLLYAGDPKPLPYLIGRDSQKELILFPPFSKDEIPLAAFAKILSGEGCPPAWQRLEEPEIP